MHEGTVAYALANFIKEGYIEPEATNYLLEETESQGRSELSVVLTGENLCMKNYDRKPRCGFFRCDSEFGMQKCVDHFILHHREKEKGWDLYMIEMKTTVGNKTWQEIRTKVKASYLNIKAFVAVLGIEIRQTIVCITYAEAKIGGPKQTTNPRAYAPLVGGNDVIDVRREWQTKQMVLDFGRGEKEIFFHYPIQMKRVQDKLKGKVELRL